MINWATLESIMSMSWRVAKRTVFGACVPSRRSGAVRGHCFSAEGLSAKSRQRFGSQGGRFEGESERWTALRLDSAGNFTDGCSPGDKECYEDESPPRKITLTRGFWLGQTEVTQAAYEKVMAYNPSVIEGPDYPVDSTSWVEADVYCKAIGGRLPVKPSGSTRPEETASARYGNIDESPGT